MRLLNFSHSIVLLIIALFSLVFLSSFDPRFILSCILEGPMILFLRVKVEVGITLRTIMVMFESQIVSLRILFSQLVCFLQFIALLLPYLMYMFLSLEPWFEVDVKRNIL